MCCSWGFAGLVGDMAFFAAGTGVVGCQGDLLEEDRASDIGLMALDAVGVGEFAFIGSASGIGIFRMGAAGSVAGFTGDGLVFELGQFLEHVGVAFVAVFFAGELGLARGDFVEGLASVPAVLSEGGGDQERAGGEIKADDREGQEDQSGDLGWNFGGANFHKIRVQWLPVRRGVEAAPFSSNNDRRGEGPPAIS